MSTANLKFKSIWQRERLWKWKHKHKQNMDLDFLEIENLLKFYKKTAIIYYENPEKSLVFDYENLVDNSLKVCDELKRLNIVNQYVGVTFGHSPGLIAVILG